MVPAPSEPPPLPRLTRVARACALVGVEAASVGLAAWILFSRAAMPEYVAGNELGSGQRRYVFIDMGVALGVAALLVAMLVVRRRGAALASVERLAERCAPLSLLWFVPLAFDRRLWVDQELLVLPLVLGFGWGLVATLRASARAGGELLGSARLACLRSALSVLARPRLPLVVVTCAAVAYAVYFSLFTITTHKNLQSHGFDLGLEDNLMWHVVHGGIPLFRSTPFSGPTGTHFGNHATWFAYVIAPFYAAVPRPETLLVLQAVLVAAAAVPLYLFASRHLPSWTSALVACAYLVYPPLHGANLYDFHYLPLGVVFLWLALYAVESNRRALAFVAIVLALSVREDVAACLAVVGLYLLLTGKAARAGAVIAAVGAGYFLLMKMFLMPRYGHVEASFLDMMYGRLLPAEESGFSGVIKSVVANPVFTANVILERGKVIYLLELLTPVLFLPWTRPVGMLLVLPGLVFTLLSTNYWPLYQPSFQYTTYWTAFAFVGVVRALEHAGEARFAGDVEGVTRRRTLLVGLLAASLACTYLGGAILHRDDVRAGFNRVSFRTTAADRQARADLAALVAQIPRDARVVASDRLLPHVSTRDSAYTLSQGTYDAEWLLAPTDLGGDERRVFLASLTDQSFGIVDTRGSFVLARRGAPAEGNMDVLRRM